MSETLDAARKKADALFHALDFSTNRPDRTGPRLGHLKVNPERAVVQAALTKITATTGRTADVTPLWGSAAYVINHFADAAEKAIIHHANTAGIPITNAITHAFQENQ